MKGSSERISADTNVRPRLLWCIYGLAGALMLAVAAGTRTRALTDWDSWEYASLAIVGKPSGLCLGRWWFIFLMRLAWFAGRGFGLTEGNGFIAMQVAVGLMSGGAVVAVMHWTYLWTGRLRTAAVAGAVAAISPSLSAYCSAVMTEGPTLLFLALAMIGWEVSLRRAREGKRSWDVVLLAGISFGVAGSLREPALLFCVWPVASCIVDRVKGRWRMLALGGVGVGLSLGFAVCVGWAWSGVDPVSVLRNYAIYMRDERQIYGFSPLRNVGFFFAYYAVACPLGAAAIAGAVIGWVRKKVRGTRDIEGLRYTGRSAGLKGTRRMAVLGFSTVPYALMTWWNPDLWFNYRLMLPFAWMWIPIAAVVAEPQLVWVWRGLCGARGFRGRVLVGGCVIVLVALVGMSFHTLLHQHMESADYQEELYDVMRTLPDDAAVIPGPGSPVGIFLWRLGIKPDWDLYRTDGHWTTDWLVAQVSQRLQTDVRVFVNLDPRGWTRAYGPNHEWKAVTEVAKRFAHRQAPRPFVELINPDTVPEDPGKLSAPGS